MTDLPTGADFGKAYGWDILVFNGPDSYGESYFYRKITFVSGFAQSPVLLSKWVTRDHSRELDGRRKSLIEKSDRLHTIPPCGHSHPDAPEGWL